MQNSIDRNSRFDANGADLATPSRLNFQFKVLFTGTLDSGKTTIVELLAGLTDAHIIPEVARDLLDQDPDIERKPEFQTQIIAEQIKREHEAEQSSKRLVILDRIFLDIICYSRHFDHQIDESPLLTRMDYSKVLLFSPFDIDVQNSLSIEMQQYRMAIHLRFVQVLQELGIPYEVISGSISARLRRIGEVLSEGREDPFGRYEH